MTRWDRDSLQSEVHLWELRLGDRGSLELLSEDERARAGRFKFDRDRDRFVACRSALRRILARYLNIAPGAVRFAYTPHGKPFVPESDLRFNVSHSGDHALIALTRGREVGVDVECFDTRLNPAEIARHFLTPGESAFVDAAAPEQQLGALLACWTRKEAWAKAVGVGITEQLDRFDVSPALGLAARTLHDPLTRAPWTVTEINLQPDVRAAVAIEGTEIPIRRHPPSPRD